MSCFVVLTGVLCGYGILSVMSKKRKKSRGYNYDTPVGTVAKDYGINFNAPPETKLGDYFKGTELDGLARILKMKI